jgi:hypothetical protein
VCGVGKQQTWTVPLPATARCNITFVEVLVGRVDPSNGNQTELGEAKRMDHPCPPLPQPAPPPPPQRIGSGVSFDWTATRSWTKNLTLGVRDVPAGAVLELRVTRADMIGKVVRFRVRRGRVPAWQILCLPPGARAPSRC